jgi:predicted DNA-binding protein (UPF0251 family)
MIDMGDQAKRLQSGQKLAARLAKENQQLFTAWEAIYSESQQLQAERQTLRDQLAQFESGELDLTQHELQALHSRINYYDAKIKQCGERQAVARKAYDNAVDRARYQVNHARVEARAQLDREYREFVAANFESGGWYAICG